VLGGLKKTAAHLAFSPDGKTLVGTDHAGNVRLWDVSTGKELVGLDTGRPGTVAFSADGKRFAAPFQDGAKLGIRLWGLDGGLKGEVPAPPGGAGGPLFTPDGKLLLFGVRGGVMLWDLAANKEIDTLEVKGPFATRCLSADGKRLAGGGLGGELAVWDLPGRKLLWSGDSGSTKRIVSLSFSPDGKRLAAGNGWGDLILCDAESGKCKTCPRPVPEDRGVANFVTFAPDGKTLYTAPNTALGVFAWDVEGESITATVNVPNAISALAVSPDGKLLAVGGLDKKVRVYAAPAAREKDK
jgi:WD40 repeat protein